MIRSEVMGWAAIFLVVIFAFILIPIHERFTDAQGRYTDVSPNSPARPSWMAAPTTDAIVQPGSIRPIDSSTAYSRTAPPVTVLGAPTSNMASAPVSGSGSSPSSTCWDVVDSTTGKFIDWHAYFDSMMKFGPKMQACVGNSPPAAEPTPAQKACFATAGMFFSLEEAQASCASDSSCTAVVAGGTPGPNTAYTKFSGDAKIVTLDLTPGAVPPGLVGAKAYIKKSCAVSSNLDLLSSPTAAAPRITSTLGTADPSLSGMNSSYTSGIIPPTGSPWPGLQTFTEMAAEVTNPAFQAQRHPNPPLGTLAPVTPDTGLFGPGPNVLRKNLVACTCASQLAGCSVHPRQ